MLDLRYEFLCEVVGELDEPQVVGPGPRGTRMIFPVKGGTVSGPRINGEALPGGGDWFLMRADGVGELDVRVTVRTEDGALIYVSYRGVSRIPPEVMQRIQRGEAVDPSEYYFRTTPVFETGSEPYSWLNHIVSVGVGAISPGRVRYKLYGIL